MHPAPPVRPARRARRLPVALAVLLAGAAAAPAQVAPGRLPGRVGPAGYLAPGAFDLLAVLPLPPRAGDARDAADRAVFRDTRALAGTERWRLATNDVKLAPADLMRDFSCAAGVVLTPADAPLTAALVLRANVDTRVQTDLAKDRYRRRRPFLVDAGPICQSAAELARSWDYPSGHTTAGWTWATLLAWAMPERATALLARGRAFSESRVVCGAHNLSAVEAGRVSAAATLDAAAGLPAFQADLAAARAELAALARDPAAPRPDPAACAAEAALVARPVLP